MFVWPVWGGGGGALLGVTTHVYSDLMLAASFLWGLRASCAACCAFFSFGAIPVIVAGVERLALEELVD